MEQANDNAINQNNLQMGTSSGSEMDYDFQRRMRARLLFVEASKNWPSYDISMDEIVVMVKEARAARYARQQDNQ